KTVGAGDHYGMCHGGKTPFPAPAAPRTNQWKVPPAGGRGKIAIGLQNSIPYLGLHFNRGGPRAGLSGTFFTVLAGARTPAAPGQAAQLAVKNRAERLAVLFRLCYTVHRYAYCGAAAPAEI